MINSRPLGYVYTDDVHKILTPSHLIYGGRILSDQYCDGIEDTYCDSVVVSKRIKYIQTLIENFCNRWNHEYLTELREHQTCGRLQHYVNVLTQSDKSKQALWKIAEVIEIIKGADSVVPAVLLRTALKTKFVPKHYEDQLKGSVPWS